VTSTRCEWCGAAFQQPHTRGPVPKYCSPSHRQRAYEERRRDATQRALAGADLAANAFAQLGGSVTADLTDVFAEASRHWEQTQRALAGADLAANAFAQLNGSVAVWGGIAGGLLASLDTAILPSADLATPAARLITDEEALDRLRSRTNDTGMTPVRDLHPDELAELQSDWGEVAEAAATIGHELAAPHDGPQSPAIDLFILAAALAVEAGASSAVLMIIQSAYESVVGLAAMAFAAASEPAIAVPISTLGAVAYLTNLIRGREQPEKGTPDPTIGT